MFYVRYSIILKSSGDLIPKIRRVHDTISCLSHNGHHLPLFCLWNKHWNYSRHSVRLNISSWSPVQGNKCKYFP